MPETPERRLVQPPINVAKENEAAVVGVATYSLAVLEELARNPELDQADIAASLAINLLSFAAYCPADAKKLIAEMGISEARARACAGGVRDNIRLAVDACTQALVLIGDEHEPPSDAAPVMLDPVSGRPGYSY